MANKKSQPKKEIDKAIAMSKDRSRFNCERCKGEGIVFGEDRLGVGKICDVCHGKGIK